MAPPGNEVRPADGLSLRPIQPEDMDFLFHLYASTREEELAVVEWEAGRKEEFLRQQFNAQHTHYQSYYPKASFDLILEDGVPVGRLYVDEWPREVRLIDISLVSQARNRGLGSRLLGELMDRGRRAGKPLTIHVEVYNPAMRLYQRLGFRKIDERGPYHLMEWVPDRSE
jgi:ribosomal protein S18 acetylase RimI-like enzyme